MAHPAENIQQWERIAPGLTELAYRTYFSGPDAYNDICPGYPRVLRALQAVGPENVRVVILGQDPYHTPGKASGLAFGYHPRYEGPVDSSMRSILEEIGRFYTVPEDFDLTLEHWAAQGVLLLNTRLTVLRGKPMSHAGIGWEQLVSKLLNGVLRIRPLDKVVFLNWGMEAQRMCPVPANYQNRIDTSHPCRYSARAGKRPFLGSNWPTRVNGYLVSHHMSPIDWTGGK